MSELQTQLEAIEKAKDAAVAATAEAAKLMESLALNEAEAKEVWRRRAHADVKESLANYRQAKAMLVQHFEHGSICFRTSVVEVSSRKDTSTAQLLALADQYTHAKDAYLGRVERWVSEGVLSLKEEEYAL